MKFRTEYKPRTPLWKLDPEVPVVMIGSCFTQNMSRKMSECGWEAVVPGGTLYNPLSIGEVLRLFSDEKNGREKFTDSLFFDGHLWHSRLFDSSFSSQWKEDCIEEFEKRSKDFLEGMAKGRMLIVTFGTAICYYQACGAHIPVGNCHKLPSADFIRRRLSIQEIDDYWTLLLKDLKSLWPDVKVVFTISPVRHLKDGFEGNSRSKAVLQLSVEKLCEDSANCDYFPAYEILNDDLRDYRFYASDLVHPSEEAVNYLWDIFKEIYLDEAAKRILEEGEKEFRRRHHRPRVGALGKLLDP